MHSLDEYQPNNSFEIIPSLHTPVPVLLGELPPTFHDPPVSKAQTGLGESGSMEEVVGKRCIIDSDVRFGH
jgi:hypothetical protein